MMCKLDEHMVRRRYAAVYVVVRANSTTGPWVVVRDGYVTYDDYYECACGDKADTRGHFTNRRVAERDAREANADESWQRRAAID